MFDVENISFDVSLVTYRVSREESARLRENVPQVKIH
jgi:hypothetical protein